MRDKKITIDYNIATGTGAVYYKNKQLCDIQLSFSDMVTIREHIVEYIKRNKRKKQKRIKR